MYGQRTRARGGWEELTDLAAGGRDDEAAGDPRRGELLHLEPEGVQRRVQLRHVGCFLRSCRVHGLRELGGSSWVRRELWAECQSGTDAKPTRYGRNHFLVGSWARLCLCVGPSLYSFLLHVNGHQLLAATWFQELINTILLKMAFLFLLVHKIYFSSFSYILHT
jgi:hypothetical protein